MEVSYQQPLGSLLKKVFPKVEFEWNDDAKAYYTFDEGFVSKYSDVYVNSIPNGRDVLKRMIRNGFSPNSMKDYQFQSQLSDLIVGDDFEWIMITID